MVLLSSCFYKSSVHHIEWQQQWVFKTTENTEWLKANVPGTVHTDLISNLKINDPYFRLNEHDLQWIDKLDWEYKTALNLSKKDLSNDHIELDFDGIDTYSKIYINDSLILQTDNMFRNFRTDVKQFLKEGTNNLHVVLESPIKKGLEAYNAQGYKIPVSNNDLSEIGQVEENKQVSIYARKAGYHFGWDWGPRLVTSGIWKPVTLKSWNHHKINDVFIEQDSLGINANMFAHIDATLSDKNTTANVEILVNNKLVKSVEVQLNQGINTFKIPFEIENAQLWWPNGLGNQVLYAVEVKLTSNTYVDKKAHKIGLRTIELIQDPDSLGTSFYFKVNGHPVFMKGANYIPQDIFLPRVKKEQYAHIINSAKDANMNMLRVWGGGIYENDDFYQLCDENGLLVWQDFMFACAMFPGDTSFLENVKQEAIYNVKRLRNHTCIALWCGNNEVLSAWENWGWKHIVSKEQSKDIADTIWNAYDTIFHNILPNVVTHYDNSRPYWPSSPGSAFGKTESKDKGDMHYWMVWWGKEPFDKYNTEIPRFMSEYGFQSFPEFSTVEKYTIPEDHDVYSKVMTSHQRSSIGNETIEEYMLRHYKKPKDFESFLYVSQLLQAHGIKVGIEAHRRHKERCMGSLYWQINDCWPVASWSSIDYYGKWKALHYAAKKGFKNLLITTENTKDGISIFVVSDLLEDKQAMLKLRLLDFEGTLINQWEENIIAHANESRAYLTINKNNLPGYFASKNVILHAELLTTTRDNILAETIVYIAPYKSLKFPEPELTYTIKETNQHFEVQLSTKKLAKDVFVSSSSTFNFSDNYFDMLPHTSKTITIKKSALDTLENFKKTLKVISLVDTYSD
jgi:beta-mannosidase